MNKINLEENGKVEVSADILEQLTGASGMGIGMLDGNAWKPMIVDTNCGSCGSCN